MRTKNPGIAPSIRSGTWSNAGRSLRRFALLASFVSLAADTDTAGAKALLDPPGLCERAAIAAADEIGVPARVLQALVLIESGRTTDKAFRPWPWAINLDGTGQWFATESKARAHINKALAQGNKNFDVGCFQINYRWHGENFGSIEEMIDPASNARYAARFLKRLYSKSEDWSQAAGAYHSRSPDLSQRYQERFDAMYARLADAGSNGPDNQPPPAHATAPRVNTYPLIRVTQSAGQLGSLVPLTVRSSLPTALSGN